ncbi:MAG: hypothetical protein RIB78_12605 [Gammaproteobacteria bacterium]
MIIKNVACVSDIAEIMQPVFMCPVESKLQRYQPVEKKSPTEAGDFSTNKCLSSAYGKLNTINTPLLRAELRRAR